MRTKAVKVLNPVTRKSIDTCVCPTSYGFASYVNFESLKDEPGRTTVSDTSVTLPTLADQQVFRGRQTNFKLESLYSGEQFTINDALIVHRFSDDVSIISHAVDSSTLGHFNGVHIPVAPRRKRINVLIGEPEKALLTVLEERENGDPD